MPPRNPFRPSFGVNPPHLVGRSAMIDDFDDALDAGPGAYGRAILVTGQRGTGKTVLLNQLEDVARTRGWRVIAETANQGLTRRLAADHLPRLLTDHDPNATTRTITGAKAGPVGVETTRTEHHESVPTLRSQLELLTDLLGQGETGLLLTLDEVHASDLDELRELFTTYQHAVREERNIAIVVAGIPHAVSDLLSDNVLTFLRRAHRIELGAVDDGAVAEALRTSITDAGRAITDDALETAVDAVRGYPFLIQLVGDLAWRANRQAETITAADAQAAAAKAPRRMGSMVHAPALSDLSDTDRTYLAAMASLGDGPIATSAVAARMGVNQGYGQMYRRRLIHAELITPVRHGYVEFTLPYLHDYLHQHVVTEALGQ